MVKRIALSKVGSKKRSGGWGRRAMSAPMATAAPGEAHKVVPALNLEVALCVLGNADSVALLTVVTGKLSTHFAGHVSKNGAKLAKHMTALTAPEHVEPAKPVREYVTKDGTVTTDRTTVSKETIAEVTTL